MKPRADKPMDGLAQSVGFDLLGEELGADVEASLESALEAGAIFTPAGDPIAIFRESLSRSIRDIETDAKGELFRRFLRDGPYEDIGPVPTDLQDKRLSDNETSTAVAFIHSHMVNAFKGDLAEFLALAPCARLVARLRDEERLPGDARIYVGDAVRVETVQGRGVRKGADIHILSGPNEATGIVEVLGVGEVKSGSVSRRRLREQMKRHLDRAALGLQVEKERRYGPDAIRIGDERRPIKIGVVAGSWRLPRAFRFTEDGGSRHLVVDPEGSPPGDDEIVAVGRDEWRIKLRWSREALASAAYAMTFWYMERVGESIYSQGVPPDWSEMTPAEAGRNAVTMMLYYAILRTEEGTPESQRATALYNTYGFGYALGMNFLDSGRRRRMLWPQDLDEIVTDGKTKCGYTIR